MNILNWYKIHLLGPYANRNDRFPYLILWINQWNPYSFIYRNPEKSTPLGIKKKKTKTKKQKQKHKSTFNLGLSTEILILGICSFQYFVKDKLIWKIYNQLVLAFLAFFFSHCLFFFCYYCFINHGVLLIDTESASRCSFQFLGRGYGLSIANRAKSYKIVPSINQ